MSTLSGSTIVVTNQVLDIVARLVDEAGGASGRRLRLEDSLEADLGLGSLERVELLLRLDAAFGVRLPESTVADAVTPQDLATAVLEAAGVGARGVQSEDAGAVGARSAVPAPAEPTEEASIDGPGHALPGLAGITGRAIYTTWIAIVLVTTLPFLWAYLAVRRPGRHAARATRLWSRLALAACGFSPRVTGLEHLRGLGSAILVANHASYIDVVVLMAALPADFHFVAKHTLEQYPLVGTVLRKGQHLTIEKSAVTDRLASADAVVQHLRNGDRLVIFAEGTFVRRPGLLPFRLGAFRAAVESGRPMVPVALAGTRRALPDGTVLFRPARIATTIGAPVMPQSAGWPEMVRLRAAAVDHIARACGETGR